MHMTRNNLLHKIILLAMATLLLASCGMTPTSATTSKTPLRVEFTRWWGDYTLIIAQEQGFFKKHGVEVELVYYDSFSQAIPDMAASRIDAGLLNIGDAINISHHKNVKIVAAYDNGGQNAIISTPNILSINDLKGKRIGVPIGTTYELFVAETLKAAGLSMADVTLVNTSPEDVQAKLFQDIDAGFTYEPFTSEATKRGYFLLAQSDELKNVYLDVIVFNDTIVRDRPEDVRAFLEAWFEAVDFRQTNPEESRRIISQYLQVPLQDIQPDDGIVLFTREDNLAIFQNEDTRGFQSIFSIAQLNIDFLIRNGVFTSSPELDFLIDPAYLQ